METMMETVASDTTLKAAKSPEEIIRIFNTKEIDGDWFMEYRERYHA